MPIKVTATTLKVGVSKSTLRDVFLKLVPDTLIDADMSLPGDFFSVVVTKPSAQLLQVPAGSRLIGKITEIEKARSFNRGAKLRSEVSQLMLPDGTIIKASATLSSSAGTQEMQKPSKTKKVLKTIKKKTQNITAATAVGAVDSIQYLGLGTAIATSGISTAIGAGLGFGLGALGAIHEKGEEQSYSTFSAMNFKLESEFELLEKLPFSATELENLIALEELGIDLKVAKIQKQFSRQFGEFLLVEMQVTNNSQEDVFLGDFVLGSNTHIRPLLANPLLSKASLESLRPKESCTSVMAFSLNKYLAKDDYKIYLLDPIDQTIMANTNVEIKNLL